MDSSSQEKDGTRKEKRKLGAATLGWVIAHPVEAFIAVTLASLVVAALLYWGSLFWPLSGKSEAILGVYSNASALVQAIVGTALVGASAFVAILIATSAAKTAESALSESRLSNKFNDPDYLAAKDALRGYQQYAFLMGSLLATYRLHRHSRELVGYAATEAKESSGALAELPAWNATLTRLQDLLFETNFISAADEAARLQDDLRGASADGHQETRVQALRKTVAGLSSTIEQALHPDRNLDAGRILMQIMARAHLLHGELGGGRAEVGKSKVHAKSRQSDGSARYPTLYWFSDWVGQVSEIESDRGFRESIARPFDELMLLGESVSVPAVIRKALAEADGGADSESEIGRHVASLMATVVGDTASVAEIERSAIETAESLGMEPRLTHLGGRMGCLPPGTGAAFDPGNREFNIFTCTRDTLPELFKEGILGPYTRGCVIIDGVRVRDSLSGIENNLQKWSLSAPDGARMGQLPSVLDFVHFMAGAASSRGDREDSALAALVPGSDQPDFGAGPRLAWIGIDYRDLGAEPPTRNDDWTTELWAIFGRGGRMFGVDSAQLLDVESRAFVDPQASHSSEVRQ